MQEVSLRLVILKFIYIQPLHLKGGEMMKIDSANINNIGINTERIKVKTSKELNSFDRILSKMTYDKKDKSETINSNKIEKVDSEKSSSKELDVNSKEGKDDSLKSVPKEIKEKLKEAGMTAEEVENISSLEDLKEMIEPDKLLAVLLSFFNSNLNSLNGDNLEGKIEEQIKAILNSNLQQNENTTNELQLKNKVIDKLFSKIAEKEILTPSSDNVSNDDLVSKIEAELIALSKDRQEDIEVGKKDIKLDKKDIKDVMSDLRLASKNLSGDVSEELNINKIEQKSVMTDVKDTAVDLKHLAGNVNSSVTKGITNVAQAKDNTSENLAFNNNSKSDEDFLNSILSDNNDKISKFTSFMSHLNNTKVDNLKAAEGENLVINKNTLNADIIKALKFMQVNNKSDLTVKIMPKELGEVVISLTVEAGVMKGTITAANKEAYNLLNSNLVDITNKLQNNDIKIENLTLNIYNEDTTFFKNGNDRERSNNSKQRENRGNAVQTIGEDIIEGDNLSEVDSNVDMLA